MARNAPGASHSPQSTGRYSLEGTEVMGGHPWFVRLIKSLVDWLGLNTLISLVLLLFAMGTVTLTLGSLLREINADLFLRISAAGILIAWLLARTRLSSRQAYLFFFMLGMAGPVLILSRLWQPLLQILLEAIKLFPGFWLWQWFEAYGPPLLGPFLQTLQEFAAAASSLNTRLFAWMSGFLAGKEVFDPLVNTILWGALVWFISAWAGWAVRRLAQPILALLPAGVVLASTLNYSGASTYSLITFLGVVFLLVLHVLQQGREFTWKTRKIDYPEDMRLDLALPTLPLVVLILVAAAIVPTISIQKIMDLTRSIRRDPALRMEQAAEALGLERYQEPFVPQTWNQGGLPRSHLLSEGPDLSQQRALIIKTGDLPPGPPDMLVNRRIPNYYWRSLTYEVYTGRGWLNPTLETLSYQAGELARFTEPEFATVGWAPPSGYRLIEHEVTTFNQASGILHAAGFLITADHPYKVAWRTPRQQNSGEPGGNDAFGATIGAQTYQAKSLLPAPSLSRLSEPTPEYYEGITSRYLSLPDSLPPRVYSLALDLTANSASAYEQARAIETYLRRLPYDLDITLAPPERDVVDYYLFDLQRGYCDYAASAMVVLARAAGLPARLVIGYAGGNYNSYQAQFEVSEADAHSWPEVFLAGVGWVEFEPTSTMPEINWPEEYKPPQVYQAAQSLRFESLPLQKNFPLPWMAVGFGLLSVLLSGAWMTYDHWRLCRLKPPDQIQAIYGRMLKSGRKLLINDEYLLHPGDTALEFAETLTNLLASHQTKGWWHNRLTPAVIQVQTLTGFYLKTVYSPWLPEADEGRAALRLWQQLRWRLWIAQWRRDQLKGLEK